MSLIPPSSPEDVPRHALVAVGLVFATVVSVLWLAKVEGNVPEWAVPLPLSFAASAGKAKVVFSCGLTFAAAFLARVLPVVFAAYRLVIAGAPGDAPQGDGWLIWFLRCSMCLTVMAFFLQAAVPFDRTVLETLQSRGALCCNGAWNMVHVRAACLLFTSCGVAYSVVLLISMRSGSAQEPALQLSFWCRLLFPWFAGQLGFWVSLLVFGRESDVTQQPADLEMSNYTALKPTVQHAVGIDQQRAVQIQGASQIGLLSAMLAFLVVLAMDVRKVCHAFPAGECKPTAGDERMIDVVMLVLVFCAFVATCCRRRR